MTDISVEVDGVDEFEAKLRRMRAHADRACRAAVSDSVTIVHRAEAEQLRLKSHPPHTQTPSAPGEPPALITGTLMRSVRDKPIAHLGTGVYEGSTGPTAVQSRIQELGGWTGRGHRTYLPPRPYVKPALVLAREKIRRRFRTLLHQVTVGI